jgi:hypothetical protein
MLPTIGHVILIGFGGTILAAIWTFLVGFGGAPGAMLAHKLSPDENWHDGSGNLSIAGLALCVIGQSYVALAFCAVAVGFTTDLLAKRPDLIRWIVWTLVFFISTLPTSFAAKDAANKPEKKTQDVATTFTFAIAAIGFWAFFFFPSLMGPWRWIPFVG